MLFDSPLKIVGNPRVKSIVSASDNIHVPGFFHGLVVKYQLFVLACLALFWHRSEGSEDLPLTVNQCATNVFVNQTLGVEENRGQIFILDMRLLGG